MRVWEGEGRESRLESAERWGEPQPCQKVEPSTFCFSPLLLLIFFIIMMTIIIIFLCDPRPSLQDCCCVSFASSLISCYCLLPRWCFCEPSHSSSSTNVWILNSITFRNVPKAIFLLMSTAVEIFPSST